MTVYEKFKEEIENSKYPVIGCKVNNKYENLEFELGEDKSSVELIDISQKEGVKIFRMSLVFVTIMASEKIFPNHKLYINYQLQNSMYCEVEGLKLSATEIEKLEDEMNKIVNSNYPIKKISMNREQAKEFYDSAKTIKGLLQYELEDNEEIEMYFCEEHFNYFFSELSNRTGILKPFKLIKYNNGFLLNYPSISNPFELQENVKTKKLAWAMEEYKDIHKILDMGTVYRLNNAIEKDKIKDMILLDEALHEKKIANIADKICQDKDIKMVLIAGPSSSGKTTFAQRLAIQLRLNKLKPFTLSVDNYFVEREETPKDEDGNLDFECIEAIDLKLFNDDLTKLLNGQTVELPTFNFKTGHKEYGKGKFVKLEENQILIIEGIHCLNDKLTSKIKDENKFKIYISCLTSLSMDRYNRISSTDTRLVRRIVRDFNFRGYSASQTIQTWPLVNKGEEKYIFPFQEKADCIFNSALVYEFCVLNKYAIPQLESIGKDDPSYAEAQRLINMLKYVKSIPDTMIPNNSLLKEFVGGGFFEY